VLDIDSFDLIEESACNFQGGVPELKSSIFMGVAVEQW